MVQEAAQPPLPDPALIFGKTMPPGTVVSDPARGTFELLPGPAARSESWVGAALVGLLVIGAALLITLPHGPTGKAALVAGLAATALAIARPRRPAARLLFGATGLVCRRPRTRLFVPWSIVEGIEPGGAPQELRLRVRALPFGPFPVSETFAPWLFRFVLRGQYRLRKELPDQRLALPLGPGHDLEAIHAAVRWFARRALP